MILWFIENCALWTKIFLAIILIIKLYFYINVVLNLNILIKLNHLFLFFTFNSQQYRVYYLALNIMFYIIQFDLISPNHYHPKSYEYLQVFDPFYLYQIYIHLFKNIIIVLFYILSKLFDLFITIKLLLLFLLNNFY